MKLMTLLAVVSSAIWSAAPASAQPPPQPPPGPCVDTADTRFVCGQQGPEDLVVVPGGAWVITGVFGGTGGINVIRVSDRTSIKAYPAASDPGKNVKFDRKAYPACPGPPDSSKFTTHGLSLLPGRNNVHRLFVVGHGGREAIEVFELDARPATPALTWIGCAVAVDPVGLNSVRGLPDGGFIASNFLPRGVPPAATQRMMAGEKNGELWEWHARSGWQKVPGSEAAGANGLEMSADGKTLYVAAWGSQSFFRLSRGAKGSPERNEVPLGFRVDNIRWARDGSILAAGQGANGTVVVRVDPKTLEVREILRRPAGSGFGAGTVAVEVGDDYWIGSFAGDRIAIVSAAKKSAAQNGFPVELVPPAKGPFNFPAGYQTPWDKIQILVTSKMSPNLFVLHGSDALDQAHPDASGGRVMVLFGPDGVLMVDTQNRQVAEKTLQAIRSFTDAPIKVVVNTHIHSDHTGANAFFAKQGALIFAQDNLRAEMLRPPARANGQPAPAPEPAAVPVSTYAYNAATRGQPAVTLSMNGETVDFIPMMPSHTAGDTIVRFRNANVIYIEDFYRNFGYPFADQANGGTIRGMLDAVDLIETLAGPDTTLVPGHGTLVKKQDLLPYRAMLVDVMAKVKRLRDQGKSLQEVLAANLTAPYDKTTLGDTQQSKDRFITEVYDEVKGLPPVVDGKRTPNPGN